MKKIITSIIMCILIGFTFTNISFAQENNKVKESVDTYIEEQLNKLKLDEIQEYIRNEDIIKDVDVKIFIKDLIKGKQNILDLFDKEGIKIFLFDEFKSSLKVASIILVLALL